MDNGTDRREARRFTMSLPVTILPKEYTGEEVKVQSRDVSYRGLYFFAGDNFEAGNEIAFVITLPKDLLKSSAVMIRCRGMVVRVDPGENGHVGIAAKIERYEFVANGTA